VVEECSIELGENTFVPMKWIKQLRRELLQKIYGACGARNLQDCRKEEAGPGADTENIRRRRADNSGKQREKQGKAYRNGGESLRETVSLSIIVRTKEQFEAAVFDMEMDAAEIDGCGKIQSFWTIVLPLSKALIGVLVVYYGVAHWNQYFNALIYISKDALRPLQMVLREILIQNSTTMQVFDESMMLELLRRERYAELIKYGVIVVASVPVLCIYPFIQKYFTKGVMLGAVKE